MSEYVVKERGVDGRKMINSVAKPYVAYVKDRRRYENCAAVDMQRSERRRSWLPKEFVPSKAATQGERSTTEKEKLQRRRQYQCTQ